MRARESEKEREKEKVTVSKLKAWSKNRKVESLLRKLFSRQEEKPFLCIKAKY